MGQKRVEAEFYLVTSKGNFKEIEITSYEELDPTQAYLIVVDQEQVIYIWRGVEISDRQKFILQSAIALLRVSIGKSYRGQWVNQGQEPPNFQVLFEKVAEEEEWSIKDLFNRLLGEENSVKEVKVDETPIEDLSAEKKRQTPHERGTRYKACWPLPGKMENYISNLTKLLVRIREHEPTLDELANWANNWFGSALEWTKSAIRITVVYTSLARIENGSLHLTETGQEFLNTKDNFIILNGFLQGIWGIREILVWLKERPLTTKELLANFNNLGVSWETRTQIGYRLKWLRVLGSIDSKGRKYYLTDKGVEISKKLGLESPPPISSVSPTIKSVAQFKDKKDEIREVLRSSGQIKWSHPKVANVYQDLLQEYIDLLRRKLSGESVSILPQLHQLAKDRLVRLGVPEANVTHGVIQGLTHVKKGKFLMDGIFGFRYWKTHGGLEAFERYLKSWKQSSKIDEELEVGRERITIPRGVEGDLIEERESKRVAREILQPSGRINWSHPKVAEVYQDLLQKYISLLRRNLSGESVGIISELWQLAKDGLVRIGVPEINITRNVIHGLIHRRGNFARDGIFNLKYWKNNGGLELFEQNLKSWEKPLVIEEIDDDEVEVGVEGEEEISEITLLDRIVQSEYTHSIISYLLARIGKNDDMYVWLATRSFSEKLLEELRTLGLYDETVNIEEMLLEKIPLRIGEEYLQIFKNIDAVFFDKNTGRVVACFEIENTPVMYSSLLRFNDLMLSPIDIRNPKIISQMDHKSQFDNEKHRHTFRKSGLSEIVEFLAYEDILIRYQATRQKRWY